MLRQRLCIYLGQLGKDMSNVSNRMEKETSWTKRGQMFFVVDLILMYLSFVLVCIYFCFVLLHDVQA